MLKCTFLWRPFPRFKETKALGVVILEPTFKKKTTPWVILKALLSPSLQQVRILAPLKIPISGPHSSPIKPHPLSVRPRHRGFFLTLPGNSQMQPRQRTTGLATHSIAAGPGVLAELQNLRFNTSGRLDRSQPGVRKANDDSSIH